MNRSWRSLVLGGALAVGALLGSRGQVAPAHADSALGVIGAPPVEVKMPPPPPDDPNKKKDGDECKSSDECQPHHTCEKQGDKKVCKAPPPPRLPPGAVT